MSFAPPNSLPYQVVENIIFSREQDQFINQLTDLYSKLARSLNSKDLGLYELTEIINGQQFFGATPQVQRSVYRKCFSFGAIATGATLNIAHNISNISILTRFYGTANTDIVDYRPIPYSSVTASNQGIELLLSGANISIINGAASPNITSGIVVIEYIKS